MILKPPTNSPERILTFGVQKTGKSNGLMNIAAYIAPEAKVYVIDNDYAYDFSLQGESDEVRDKFDISVVDEWEETIEKITELRSVVKRDDWFSIDLLSSTWDQVQDWFTEQIFGKEIDEYFLAVRKDKERNDKDAKALGALEGWMDWPVINKTYRKLQTAILRMPCNVYCTAELALLTTEDNADKEVKALYGPYGVKPKGQKRTGHFFHTILLTTKSRAGEFALTTVGDRAKRRELEDDEVGEFAKDYLMKVAGWRPGK